MIQSWLLDLAAAALRDSPNLDSYAGRVSFSGEGRWTLQAAIDESVQAPVISAALSTRFTSRGEADYGDRVPRRSASGSAAIWRRPRHDFETPSAALPGLDS